MPLKKGSVDPDGTIWCYGSGIRCIVSTVTVEGGEATDFSRFAVSRNTSLVNDEALIELSKKINELIVETHTKRKNPELKLGFLITDHGILPVWKRELDDTQDIAQFTSVENLVSLDNMSDAELADFLQLE
jgi:hypothetical protein